MGGELVRVGPEVGDAIPSRDSSVGIPKNTFRSSPERDSRDPEDEPVHDVPEAEGLPAANLVDLQRVSYSSLESFRTMTSSSSR